MVPDNYQLPNLTRVAQKGLDLYIKRDGKWQFAGVGIPGGVTTEKVLVDNMGTEEFVNSFFTVGGIVRYLAVSTRWKYSPSVVALPTSKSS